MKNSIESVVPIGHDEERRLKVLRECSLLDSSTADPNFDRFTSLCRRLFNVNIKILTDIIIQYFTND